ncbi:MAG: sugar transferase [Bacteroidia bacterium]|nr:sugar transferase [Bacteroidia bacterium]
MQEKFGALSLRARKLKRLVDVVLALLGLLIFSPLFLIIYLVVKMQDRGNAIFKQERVGYKGVPFMLYKFRSMRTDAEKDGKPLLFSNNDPRLTPIGGFLRKYHVDELPQLWNVLKGDMSFVGYRPERQFFIDQIMTINPDYELLYQIRPGLFSEATLYNGYTDTIEKMIQRLKMDLAYFSKQSFWFDMKIIFLTAIYLVSGKRN